MTKAPSCKSCGVPFVEHLGVEGTCAELLQLRGSLEVLSEIERKLRVKGLACLDRIAALSSKLPCGHPSQCDPGFGSEDPGATHACLWCEEVARLMPNEKEEK